MATSSFNRWFTLPARILRIHSVIISLAGALLLSGANSLEAQFLVINDCNGFTRAVEQVGDNARNIELDVSGSQGNVSGARVSLRNDITGEFRFSAAKGGKVVFAKVPPGIYTIATEQTGLILGAIKFSPLAALGAVGSSVIGGLVVGGGAVIGVVGVEAIREATDGDPGAAPTPTPNPEPTPDDCAVCDPDSSPPPLDEEDFADAPAQAPALSPSR
jgi:hypothetical protein